MKTPIRVCRLSRVYSVCAVYSVYIPHAPYIPRGWSWCVKFGLHAELLLVAMGLCCNSSTWSNYHPHLFPLPPALVLLFLLVLVLVSTLVLLFPPIVLILLLFLSSSSLLLSAELRGACACSVHHNRWIDCSTQIKMKSSDGYGSFILSHYLILSNPSTTTDG